MIQLIKNFYQSLSDLDPEGMISNYHDEVEFEDPAFGKLKGERAKNMWRMLCNSQKGQHFKVSVSEISFDNGVGKALCRAEYFFGKTNRKVNNIISAEFRFRDGKIIEHRDRFDLHRWSRQALGFTGLLLGWTGFFKRKLNRQTNKWLSDFENKRL